MAKFSIKDGEGIIPSRTTVISRNAFLLKSIIVPSSVTKIEIEAFSGCSYLDSIAVSEENPIYDSRESCNAIIETATGKLIAGCPTTRIPQSVTEIGDRAFEDCTELISIVIPDSVTKIVDYAFAGCTGLTSIIIPDSVSEIGEEAFSGCTGLTSIVIPSSVTEIGDDVFKGCIGMTSIVISSFLPIEFLNSLPDQCPNLKHLFVPASLLDAYNDKFSVELCSLVSSY